jgi:tetratricopeptide (TPR) repeat protein
MRRVALALSLALAGALLIPPGVPEAAPQHEGRPMPAAERIDAWLTAVRAHQPGTLDPPARDIASWPDDHLFVVLDDVAELTRFMVRAHVRLKRTGQQPGSARLRGRTLSLAEVQRLFGLTDDEAARGDVARVALRGALLHTDITIIVDEYDPLRETRRPSTRTSMRVSDGRLEGIADRGPHWDAARALLDLVPADSPAAARRQQWYAASAAFMHSRGRLSDLLPHVQHARRLLPDDPDVSFYAGALHETFSSPAIQAALRTLKIDRTKKPVVGDARTHRDLAAGFFRVSLERHPGNAEARVRLGRVLGELGRRDEAERELRRALDATGAPRIQYLANLFLGGVQMRGGRDEDARASFDRASALYPRAQSPRIALSSLARKRGRRADTTAGLLEGLSAMALDDERDPWFGYFETPPDRADGLIDAWRTTLAAWSLR